MEQSWKSWNGLFGLLILACLSTPPAQASNTDAGLRVASNLAKDAETAARLGGPLVVIYSRDDCSFCKTIKRDYLKPLSDDPKSAGKQVIREVRQDKNTELVDFQGRKTTHAALAKAEKVQLVPVVAFYGPGGKKLHEPIIGARLPDFYQSYLETAIEQSARTLKNP